MNPLRSAIALAAAFALGSAAADGVPARYLVLDLSAGAREDACYPVRFLDAPPPGGWGAEYVVPDKTAWRNTFLQ